jgi:ATP-dependent Clp protease ATP-binding subunit ClpA
MTRFDMSEFSDAASIARLIGSFETGEAGLLASRARDAGHGVVLFDEIEKAHEKVRDLMLQILDEGYFTDARGNKVNMKNFIMIATSNAGSGEIYEAGTKGVNTDKKMLVDHIIEQGVFKPEFLNRFDEIAVFNALGDRQLASIVSLKLEKYASDLYEKKAVHLTVTPVLVEQVMKGIENKAFGGREIQRAIQNSVESLIAKDIISGRAKAGSTVSFAYNNEEKSLVTMYT